MRAFRCGIDTQETVQNELARNGYKLYNYDLYYNYYTYVVSWTVEHLTTRMYIFNENDILKEIRTINNY